jgi:hypothetical protein
MWFQYWLQYLSSEIIGQFGFGSCYQNSGFGRTLHLRQKHINMNQTMMCFEGPSIFKFAEVLTFHICIWIILIFHILYIPTSSVLRFLDKRSGSFINKFANTYSKALK